LLNIILIIDFDLKFNYHRLNFDFHMLKDPDIQTNPGPKNPPEEMVNLSEE